MNPFDANERHRYIIESGGNPVSSADGKEKEIWVNSINIDGKHGKIDPVGTDEIDPVKTA